MKSLAERVRFTQNNGHRTKWSRTQRRFPESLEKAPRSHRMDRVSSYVGLDIMNRLLGHIAEGEMANLYGATVYEQLQTPEWNSANIDNEHYATNACILHLDGVELSDRARQTLASRLRDARRHDDMPLYPMLRGLCGIYLGLPDVWQAETDVPWSDDYAFTPGRSFGGNVKGLMTYLGAATLRGASFEDVEPALLNFIAEFDALRAAGFVYFEHLVLVGVIAGHCIGDVPRAEALDWFGQYLCWVVGLREDKPESAS